MSKRIEYILADPEGNRTLLVFSPVEREDYQETARALLDECPEAEQVGFVKEPVEYAGCELPCMEMCGLEFCGNATRAFAFYEASRQDPPLDEIVVKVSGTEDPLRAWIDHDRAVVRLSMPIPYAMRRISISLTDTDGREGRNVSGELVEMEGIAHLIVMDVKPEEDTFVALRDYVYENIEEYPAFGVMFVDISADMMTPVVYVKDVDTVYFEGSCASGTVAAAYAMTATSCVPLRTHVFRQPEGTLSVEVHVSSGQITQMLLEGRVSLGPCRYIDA